MTKPRPKPSRALGTAALVVACFLLPAGLASHGHDDGNLDDHDPDCVTCLLRDHSVLLPAAAPDLAAPAPLAPVAASTRQGHGFLTALDPGLTRGPPA
ncbi:MAG: hypothetical protein OXH75_14960 [Acidobacteria bacterium]|nr:hypothetical protein [Acidobacteriota bacterium]